MNPKGLLFNLSVVQSTESHLDQFYSDLSDCHCYTKMTVSLPINLLNVPTNKTCQSTDSLGKNHHLTGEGDDVQIYTKKTLQTTAELCTVRSKTKSQNIIFGAQYLYYIEAQDNPQNSANTPKVSPDTLNGPKQGPNIQDVHNLVLCIQMVWMYDALGI